MFIVVVFMIIPYINFNPELLTDQDLLVVDEMTCQ